MIEFMVMYYIKTVGRGPIKHTTTARSLAEAHAIIEEARGTYGEAFKKYYIMHIEEEGGE